MGAAARSASQWRQIEAIGLLGEDYGLFRTPAREVGVPWMTRRTWSSRDAPHM